MAQRIVALGASAGGLEPLEQIFRRLPADSGCSFVVVQHLSPDFRSMMDELLARGTAMRIRRVEDGMALEPDCIYLNVPRSLVTLRDLRVALEPTPGTDLVHRPIDVFLASLAEQHGERALAVLLSGTGSDGLRGCEAIKEHGGTVLAQSPDEARFDSMPRAVIDAELADLVAPAAALARNVLVWSRGEPLERTSEKEDGDEDEEDSERTPLERVLALLDERYDTDFRNYKPSTIERRLARRAAMVGAADLETYVRMLRRDADELDELYGDLLIEVTSFFRDAEAFERLAERVLPELVERLSEGQAPRVWVAGCASGEEAYSIAMLLAEQADRAGLALEAKIFASDIHGRSLERAAAGLYPLGSVSRLSEARVDAFFERHGDQVQVRQALRRLVMFSTHDVLRDSPFTRIDLVSCRNLLIYLNNDAQQHVLAKFHFALRRGGCLFLGPSEGLADLEREFDTIDRRWRLYRKNRDTKLLRALEPRFGQRERRGDGGRSRRVPVPRALPSDEQSLHERRAYRLALERIVAEHAPPGFLLDAAGSIVHIFGDAGQLLPMGGGPFSRDVRELVRAELRPALTVALQRAAQEDFEGYRHRSYLREANGRVRPCELRLERVDIGDEGHRFHLLRVDLEGEMRVVGPTSDGVAKNGEPGSSDEEPIADEFVEDELALLRERVRVLEQGLRASEESLQTTIEELETSNEELSASNEELQSANEELQSTNEELHSVNEELYTVSAEHQRRSEELAELNADREHLLDVSEIGTLFLDSELRLRRFSERARGVFDVREHDIGRGIGSIENRLSIDLPSLLREVIETRERREVDVAVDDRHQLLRAQPYENRDGKLLGVLLANVDVTELSDAKRELERLATEYRQILEDTESFIVRWRAEDGAIVYCNERYSAFFDASPEAMLGKDVHQLIPPEERERFFAEIEAIEPGESRFLTVTREESDGRFTHTAGYSRAIADEHGRVVEYQSIAHDISDEYAYRRALERLLETVGDASLGTAARLERILAIGLDYLRLDSAFASRIDGEDYHVVAVAGAAAERHAPGDTLALAETVCANLPPESKLLTVTHLGESELADHPCYAATGIETFIGTRLATAEGLFGSVSFSSTVPREQPFSVEEESFVLLATGWIAYLLNSSGQLERIRDENAYYQALYQHLPVMICLADVDGTVFETSDAWLDALGRECETSLGEPFVGFLREEDRARAEAAIGTGAASALPVRVLRGDGGALECEMDCLVERIGTRQDVRLIVLTDVSARVRAIEKVEARNRQLAEVNERLDRFAFVASHDLQEPLRKIRQFSSFLSEDLDDDNRYHLDVIGDAATRMGELIDGLLRYSRATRVAPADFVDRTVALDEVVAQVRQDLALSLEEAEARLEVDPLPEVAGDPMLLGQLFGNLIGNALKYRDPARPPEIRLRYLDGEDGERLTVEDNGIGFDPAYSQRIFEPFTRLHGTKERRGSGIGLAICAAVCQRHGWRLSADGRPGAGSVFTIALAPDADAEAAE